ncbi:MAG: hypothetical protein JSS09_04290 [Verrucomicrobia bacterium]|nr:hypothetical protein [Verrucomicrobiota bacterium]
MNNDLFDNPMVRSARQALTPEQLENYRQIGQYMYSNTDYINTEVKSAQIKKANPTDLLNYAVQMLKSGGDPKDLTEDEMNMLISVYGEKWYQQFDLDESEVPARSPMDAIRYAEEKLKGMKLSRQQRRMMERRIEKEKKKLRTN